MVMFDGHLKCARCRDKGVGDHPCIQKKDCPICKEFTAEQVQQLASPTYRTRKEKEQKKTVSASPVTSTPTVVDPREVKLLGRVEGGWVTEETAAGKKKRSDESPKPSKKKSSSKPTSEDLKSLDDKWAQRFARFEAKLLAKSFTVLVELVQKPAEVVTSEKPFFQPEAGTSKTSTGAVTQPAEKILPVQVLFRPPGMLLPASTATQPVEAPGTIMEVLPA